MNETVSISTVTPVYNGSRYLADLVEELNNYRQKLLQSNSGILLVESIFVVDDAIDESEKVLSELSKNYDWIRVVVLSRNFGQHPATIAGILHSAGDWVVTLDEDLQHKPKDITTLLEAAVNTKADIVYANSPENTHKSIVKDFLAKSFKQFTSVLMSNPNVKNFNSFRLIRGSVGRAAAAICRHETYLDVALSWFTKRVSSAPISLIDERNQSKEEQSGYSLWGLIKHGKRMIMSSKIKLLRIGLPIGVFAFLLSTFLSIFAIIRKLANFDSMIGKGWASTILVILFFGGLSVILLGFVLEILSDIVLSINGKPTFFVVDRNKDSQLAHSLQLLQGDSKQTN